MPAGLEQKNQHHDKSLFAWLMHKKWPALVLALFVGAWLFFLHGQRGHQNKLLNQVLATERLRQSAAQLSSGDWISNKQKLSTAIDGWAILRLGRGEQSSYLRIFANSVLQFTSADKLQLERGQIWLTQKSNSNTQALACQDRLVQCQKQADCDFVLRAADKYCTLQVYAGVVRLADTQTSGKWRELKSGQKQSWRAGQNMPNAQQITKREDQKIWQKRMDNRHHSLMQMAQDLLP